MISFECDYLQGAHPKVLERLIETNMEQQTGYGMDEYSIRAQEKIRLACQKPDAEVFLLTGGTQTNAVIIGTMLQPYEGVIAAESGHVAVHEAGAIEYTGHKVLTLPAVNGKLQAEDVETYLAGFFANGDREHMVFPGMVYISHPSECGSLYSKQELVDLKKVCDSYQLPLFVDGARLGYGLMSRSTDVTLPELASIADVFYIGGTKVGALCGEAVVFTHGNAPKQFRTMTKQRGAMVAKGRLLGVQFDALFTDDLYFEISAHAIDMAEKLKGILVAAGLPLWVDSPTNQQFVILENSQMERLADKVGFCVWEKTDESHTAVRFATSWATTEDDLDQLKEILSQVLG